ncbi:hydroxypyruvate isomerase family protein [Paracoccus sp. SCSIO 75233]|uniref:hydroxypyruvate isomerase family protein n=1 Tax=Paracoccus sp. SCSIO 75233 TaxID=3017782 RepID=UPI0022F084F1|nr:TIM barrel protein [Paracoccus sp. SCSIO 75233]WBU55332.1 TIM barrel protein [Paracoccus sp. SCSIO 75233]
MIISANLGFLFTDLALPDAVRAATRAGFDAVEFHFPYETTSAAALRAVLDETSLPSLALNTWPGDRDAGEFGLSALPGCKARAREEIDRAVAYAVATGTRNVHVMAGRSDTGATSDDAFCDALGYACETAAPHGIGILIEPINIHDVPGYHLSTPEHAAKIIAALGAPNLSMMLDCYHMGRMGRDVAADIRAFAGITGHIQIAAVPDRGPPDHGMLDYLALAPTLAATGLAIGAEYRPTGKTGSTLSWLVPFRAAA